MFMRHAIRLGAAALTVWFSLTAQAQLSGAIFTTLSDGNQVNANIFSAKCDALGVYLDGGPGPNAPQGAAGLLSTDAQKHRRFTVSGGIITAH